MKYQEAMEYMKEVRQYGSVLGLDNMRELCARLGNPQNELTFIHIAGTNGKGSVLAYLSTILKQPDIEQDDTYHLLFLNIESIFR